MTSNGFAPGKHLLIDFYSASPESLSNISLIEQALRHAAEICGATVLNVNLHAFGAQTASEPENESVCPGEQQQGVTGVALLAESHISIHTWPETGFAAIDIFMCGQCNPERAVAPLQALFQPGETRISTHHRGNQTALLSPTSSANAPDLSQNE